MLMESFITPACSIASLIRSSLLFDRAVMWSGAFSDWIAARMTKQEALFSEIVRRLCAKNDETLPAASSPIACLEGAAVGALLGAATQAVEAVCSSHACLQPTIDGVELTDDPRALFAVPGAVPRAVPMMLGSTLDEGDGFDAGGGLPHQSSAQQAR
jgi:carboxylesterase type B